MYTLSKDYNLLFSFVEAGHQPLAFVDYKWDKESNPLRDVCRIRRHEPFHIDFGVRGMSYGSVDKWDKEDGGKSERSLFITECIRMNLEWVCP